MQYLNNVLFLLLVFLLMMVGLSENTAAKTNYDEIADFIAGIPPKSDTSIPAALLKSPAWSHFAKGIGEQWASYDSSFLKIVSGWSNGEFPDHARSTTLFYPFSGPDFVNATVFFPSAKKYVLIGLEPIGIVPDIARMSQEELSTFLRQVDGSLSDVLSFSFFKTKSMKVDLANKGGLNGTIPILMFFLARTGHSISAIEMIYLDESGRVVIDREDDTPSGKARGVEISFTARDGVLKKLLYFSIDLSNDGFKKRPEFVQYVERLGQFNTFVKSASYLMHNPGFSLIRGVALSQSKLLLQDDSGIPFSFFADDKWERNLYGVYTGPISLFSNEYQPDLAQVYGKSNQAKPLKFGIGYKWRKNQSNLLLAIKKDS